jgi:hypothetical protein
MLTPAEAIPDPVPNPNGPEYYGTEQVARAGPRPKATQGLECPSDAGCDRANPANQRRTDVKREGAAQP